MSMKAVVLTLAAFLASCTHLAFQQQGFTPDETNIIAQAAAKWNAVTLPEKQITFNGDHWLIVKEQTPPGTAGWTVAYTRRISVLPGLTADQTYRIALHEFGHSIGLMHLANGVMNPDNIQTEFSAEDMAECHRVNACR